MYIRTECDDLDLNFCWQHASNKTEPTCQEFMTLAELLMTEESLQVPSTAEGLHLYFNLIDLINQ